MALGMIVVVAPLLLILNICAIVYSIKGEDNTCQHGTRAGLYLSDWLMIVGIEGLTFSILTIVFTIIPFIYIPKFPVPTFVQKHGGLIAGIFACLHIIFMVIMWIIGIVIISTNENNRCLSRTTELGIMSLMWLIFTWSSLAAIAKKN